MFFFIFALLAWDITSPMITAIIWAGMLSFISMPLYRLILASMWKGRFPGAAAGITLAALLLLCFVPVLLALSTLGNEAAGLGRIFAQLLSNIQQHANNPAALEFPAWTPAWAAENIRVFLDDSQAVRTLVQNIAQWSTKFLSSLSANIIEHGSSFLINSMITLMVSFFFIRDGQRIVDYIKSITPLTPEEKESFFTQISGILNSIIYGIILTVAIQALIGGLGWWFVGLNSPVFFGMLMFFFGMFPAGTAVIWVPGAIYLALTGDMKNAVILFVWGLVVVGTIDNLLRPFLISGGGKSEGREIPTLLIVLGLFGGVMKWGFLGVFVGPLMLVLFVSVCDLYRKRWLESGEKGC
ncbi:MAG: AI-2E family transporter [Synergistaceae bacterium]|nr:AI-2E family transporter [Synergistaceae bacterium]